MKFLMSLVMRSCSNGANNEVIFIDPKELVENDESQDQLIQSISKRNQAQNDVTKADTQQLDSTNNLKRTKPKYSEVLHRKDSLEDKDVQTSEHLDIDNSQFIDLPPIEETQNHSDEEQENVDINQMKKEQRQS